MAYKVDLPVYNGPLDLLLYLIKREEVDITEVELARLADQYIEHVNLMKELDIEPAGEFLVLAATLLEIKSRALLPRPPLVEDEEDEGEEDDPGEELVRQLIAYRRYKEAAGHLGRRGVEMARRVPRQVDPRKLQKRVLDEDSEPDPTGLLEDVELWDLFEAFSNVIKTLGYQAPREVIYDDTPVEDVARELEERLQREKSVVFEDLFESGRGLGYAVATFLAMLELMRQRRLGVEQAADFAEIRLYWRNPDEETYTPTKPKGARAYSDGLKRKRPRRPTARQKERLQEMMEDVDFEKTEFDEALEAIDVPDVEAYKPIYSDDEIMGRDAEDEHADETDEHAATADRDEETAPSDDDAPSPAGSPASDDTRADA